MVDFSEFLKWEFHKYFIVDFYFYVVLRMWLGSVAGNRSWSWKEMLEA